VEKSAYTVIINLVNLARHTFHLGFAPFRLAVTGLLVSISLVMAVEPDPMLQDSPAQEQKTPAPAAGASSSNPAAVPDPMDPAAIPTTPPPPKDLVRFRERLADWTAGKGGWSKRAGKILSTDRSSMVTPDGGVVRPLLDGEALRTGAVVQSGTNQPVIFQSGAGILHQLAPNSMVHLFPLNPEVDEPFVDANINGAWDPGETFTDTNKNGVRDLAATEVNLELIKGRMDTWIPEVLNAPRGCVVRLGNGDAARIQSGSFTLQREQNKDVMISCLEGEVLISKQEGGMLQATIPAGSALVAGQTKVDPLPSGGALPNEFEAFRKEARTQVLLDACEDAVSRLDVANVGEIVQAAKINLADCFQATMEKIISLRPEMFSAIQTASGLSNLVLSKAAEAKIAALKILEDRFSMIRGTGIDPYAKLGQVLSVEGVVKVSGQPIKKDQVLPAGTRILTGAKTRVRLLVAPGAYASIEPNSDAILQEMKAEITDGKLTKRSAILKNDAGLVIISIKEWDKDKTDIWVSTPFGQSRAMGTVFGTSNDGSSMTVTTTQGTVQATSADGSSFPVSAGTQGSMPGGTAASPIAPGNPVVAAANSLNSSLPTTQQLLAVALADAKTNPAFAAAMADAGDARAGASAADNLILASDGLADNLANTDTAAGGNVAGTATAAGGGNGAGGGAGAGAGAAGAAVAGLNPVRPQSPSSP